MNLCKDCKHFKYTLAYGDYHRCTYEPWLTRDTTMGKIEYSFCSINRSYSHRCDTEGKHFEQKKTGLDRWLST